MKKIIVATGNLGKLNEIRQVLSDLPMALLPQSELKIREVEETGLTFVENAIIKARYACQKSGLPAIADDSGLAVDALEGKPGIHSARYAGSRKNDSSNIEKLLHDLENVSDEHRGAQFYCVIVYMRHEQDPTPIICQGSWRGSIMRIPRGNSGFGYDPVFYLSEQQCTAAELSAEDKNRLSHRGQALHQLKKKLNDLYE
ncbi:MAG: XTP/dITP diphosphatase [Proteobacteria bacterium]|nr:XTP/dITP diphosphatase [Pseudomonadota bacterium]